MAKHTPGPWAFKGNLLLQDVGNRKYLGTYTEMNGLGYEAEANKALIAAAPDLLAALERMAKDFADRNGLPCEYAVAAITKAKL